MLAFIQSVWSFLSLSTKVACTATSKLVIAATLCMYHMNPIRGPIEIFLSYQDETIQSVILAWPRDIIYRVCVEEKRKRSSQSSKLSLLITSQILLPLSYVRYRTGWDYG